VTHRRKCQHPDESTYWIPVTQGHHTQVMGDGIMALFGAPLAHEDHAVRACCAALGMQGP